MSCIPGMPCFDNIPLPTINNGGCGCSTAFFPNNCLPSIPCINSTNVCYSGGDLPNSGINTNDNLTLALSKIDAHLTSTGFTLTTTGNSGPSTLISGILNIPNYTLAGLGGISLTSLSGGTGISYNNTTGVITNSLPDLTVSLTQGTGITITGAYPNFTITNSAPDQIVTLTQGANITITGTYPNFTIAASGGGGGGLLTASQGLTAVGTDVRLGGSFSSGITVSSTNASALSLTTGSGAGNPTSSIILTNTLAAWTHQDISGGVNSCSMQLTSNRILFNLDGIGVGGWDRLAAGQGNFGIGISSGQTHMLSITGYTATNCDFFIIKKNGGATEVMSVAEVSSIVVIKMPNLPTSSAGLPSGALWNNSNVINIVP